MPGVGQTRGTVAYGERAESRFAWSGATSRMSDSLLKFGGSPNYLDADKLRHRRTANNPTELLLWENESRRNPTFALTAITPTLHVWTNSSDIEKADSIGFVVRKTGRKSAGTPMRCGAAAPQQGDVAMWPED